MTDKELIEWLRNEAAYWEGDGEYAPMHPDGAEEEAIKMLTAAANRLEQLAR